MRRRISPIIYGSHRYTLHRNPPEVNGGSDWLYTPVRLTPAGLALTDERVSRRIYHHLAWI
jgi:hypothetical protein